MSCLCRGHRHEFELVSHVSQNVMLHISLWWDTLTHFKTCNIGCMSQAWCIFHSMHISSKRMKTDVWWPFCDHFQDSISESQLRSRTFLPPKLKRAFCSRHWCSPQSAGAASLGKTEHDVLDACPLHFSFCHCGLFPVMLMPSRPKSLPAKQ